MTARLSGLDGIRGLAALGVVTLHVSFYTPRPWEQLPAVGAAVGGLRLGVAAFFVLSAFLLAGPWLAAARGMTAPPDLRRYVVGRLARVLPAYYAALLFAAAVLAGTGSPRMPAIGDVPLLLLLVQNWSESAHGVLVPPSWTLCVELSFYLVLPVLGAAMLRWCPTLRRQLAACAGISVGSLGCNAAIEVADLPDHWHGTLPSVAYCFAAGVAAAAVRLAWSPGRRDRPRLLVAGTSLTVSDVLLHHWLDLPLTPVVRDLPAAVGLGAVVLAVAAGPGRVLGSAPLRWLGERSYAIYLVHYPVLLGLAARGHLPQSFFGALAFVLLVSVILAELSWSRIERPALKRVKRRAVPAPVARRGAFRGQLAARAEAGP